LTDRTAEAEAGRIFLGYIERAHGLKGGLVVRIFTAGDMPGLPEGTSLLLDGVDSITVRRCTARNEETILLQTEEIRNREDAEAARGRRVFIDQLEAEERLPFFPLYGFIGMRIISGGRTFSIVDMEALPSNPLLILEGAEGSRFGIPLNLAMSGEMTEGTIEVELPTGIEDLWIK